MGCVTTKLTAKQAKFVDHYVITGSGAEAARLAGYSEKTARAIAAENLTKPDVLNAIHERQQQYRAELQVTKEEVINGILSAIDMAREQQNPAAMIQGCVQLAKLLGYYEPEVRRVAVGSTLPIKTRFAAMTDEELLAILGG